MTTTATGATAATRSERDSMGEFEVPADAYYGASTMRAKVNFPISDLRLPRGFIHAIGLIKQQAALVNRELGLLDENIAGAIIRAAQDVVDGTLDAEFIVDVFQTGSGTSTNMNANEVIANRAIELLGGVRGSRTPVHPNDHVNLGQSSNDVIPTAIQLAAAVLISEDTIPGLRILEASLRRKSDELWPVIKTGRTHLQDATPIRLGQEFLGYAGQVERARRHCEEALGALAELPLGGTAVGTGVGTHPEFPAKVIALLAADLGIPLRETDNHFSAQSTLDAVVAASGALRSTAVAMNKIAGDIRLLGCGPRAGIAEIAIPEVQPGSSIMPGKVNPVICESVTMVAAQVIGNDATIAFCGAAGSLLELNVMMPVAAYDLLQSASLLGAAARNLASQCVDGITATENGPALVERGLMLCTALTPVIGYDAAAAIAKEAYKTGRTVREVARERSGLDEAELTRLLDPEAMTRPGRDAGPAGG
ncbi:MAG: class II fumarate hydratase [Candidatus Dormiibacterota bacterium]